MVGRALVLDLVLLDVRPGRPDVQVGPPHQVTVPDEVWWDDDVWNLTDERHGEYLKEMARKSQIEYEAGQDALFP